MLKRGERYQDKREVAKECLSVCRSCKPSKKLEHFLVRYVESHGRRFRVETIEVPLPATAYKRRQRERTEPDALYAKNYRKHTALLRSAKVTAAVWNVYDELSWRDFKSRGEPFKLSNYMLGDLNISHDSKTRALKKLEALGIIRIERPPGKRSPMINFLK